MEELAGKKLAVIGAGREGAALTRWLLAKGNQVTVCDTRSARLLEPVHAELSKAGASWRLGQGYLEKLTDFDVIFRSPGVPFLTPQLQAAAKAGVELTSQTKLFFARCPALIIGVSGTKGKGTTAGLLTAILKKAGQPVHLGGNIGTPPIEFLDSLAVNDLVVLELSSFQLQDLTASPHIGILTNLTLDHLEYHRDEAEYHRAKHSLLTHQQAGDYAILNADDDGSQELTGLGQGTKLQFSHHHPVAAGAFVEQEKVTIKLPEGQTTVCSVADIPIPGRHNLDNVLAASLAATLLNVPPGRIAKAIRGFHGLPYHLEFIGEKNGVRFYNDSYATNQTAAIPAVESFNQPTVLIVGGHDKKLDYGELAETIVRHPVKALVLIKPVGQQIAAAVAQAAARAGRPAPTQHFITAKEEIVPAAVGLAEPGDVVLLSPAAASFGLFKGYKDRGAYFTEQVKQLKLHK